MAQAQAQANSASILPYLVPLGNETGGLSADDINFLNGIDSQFVVHRWLWWSTENPFKEYRNKGATEPQWKAYTETESNTLENGYQVFLQNKTKDNHKINETFCARYNCTYNTKKLMAQGRNTEEENPDVPNIEKRRRPIARVSFCWCSLDPRTQNYVPFPSEVSKILEDALAKGLSRHEFVFQSQNWNADFVNRKLIYTNTGFAYTLGRYGSKLNVRYMSSSPQPQAQPQAGMQQPPPQQQQSQTDTIMRLVNSFIPGIQ